MNINFVFFQHESVEIEYISSILKKNGHKTSLVFSQNRFEQLDKVDDIVKRVAVTKPNLIVFFIYSIHYPFRLELTISKLLKERLGYLIMFGGFFTTPEQLLKNEGIDILCLGEAEQAIPEFVEYIKNNKEFDNCRIPNIWIKKDEEIIRNECRLLIRNFDELPFPDKRLFYNQAPKLQFEYIIRTRWGCPQEHQCGYCLEPILRRRYAGQGEYSRQRSISSVLNELLWAKRTFNPKTVLIIDEIFAPDINWLREFSERYKEEIGLPFKCFYHIEHLDFETAYLLKQAGCYMIMLGIESPYDNVRKRILSSNITDKNIETAIDACHKFGLQFQASHIFNLPYEKREDRIKALRFYNRIRPSLMHAGNLFYLPQASITKIGFEAGVLNATHKDRLEKGEWITSSDTNPELRKELDLLHFYCSILPFLPKTIVSIIIKLFEKGYSLPFPCLFLKVRIVNLLVRLREKKLYLYLYSTNSIVRLLSKVYIKIFLRERIQIQSIHNI